MHLISCRLTFVRRRAQPSMALAPAPFSAAEVDLATASVTAPRRPKLAKMMNLWQERDLA